MDLRSTGWPETSMLLVITSWQPYDCPATFVEIGVSVPTQNPTTVRSEPSTTATFAHLICRVWAEREHGATDLAMPRSDRRMLRGDKRRPIGTLMAHSAWRLDLRLTGPG
jgi:hypothetical protein